MNRIMCLVVVLPLLGYTSTSQPTSQPAFVVVEQPARPLQQPRETPEQAKIRELEAEVRRLKLERVISQAMIKHYESLLRRCTCQDTQLNPNK